MTDVLSVDPQRLRDAAARLDTVFETSGVALRDMDSTIEGCADGWKEPATAAFIRFTAHLAGRTETLRRELAELSEGLHAVANTTGAQDVSTAQRLAGDLEL